MNIALMSHDRKKELMVQFCIAYCGILSKHTICATSTAAASRSAPASPTTRSTWCFSSQTPSPTIWTRI
mgnify:CR=1 FL=1